MPADRLPTDMDTTVHVSTDNNLVFGVRTSTGFPVDTDTSNSASHFSSPPAGRPNVRHPGGVTTPEFRL